MKVITIKYDRSFNIAGGMRETFTATVMLEGGESPREGWDYARQQVIEQRKQHEALRKADRDA